jgi:hypothetical protein
MNAAKNLQSFKRLLSVSVPLDLAVITVRKLNCVCELLTMHTIENDSSPYVFHGGPS